jgi:hypothetical protein
MAEMVRASSLGLEQITKTEAVRDQTAGRVIRGGGERGSIESINSVAGSSGEADVTPSGTEIDALIGRTKMTAVASVLLFSWQQDIEHFIGPCLLGVLPPWCSHSFGDSAGLGRTAAA